MSDWGSTAIIDAFPRAGKVYFIQFINEPELRDRVDQQSGRKYTQLEVNLQFYALTEFGTYEYIGWGNKSVQPCVFEDLLLYRSELLENMYKVEGFEHKRHVDLECKKRLPRQQASETLTRDAQTGPPKPAAVARYVPEAGCHQRTEGKFNEDGSERGQPGAGGEHRGDPDAMNPPPATSPCQTCGEYSDACACVCAIEEPPATPCSHENIMIVKEHEVGGKIVGTGFYCQACGERVG